MLIKLISSTLVLSTLILKVTCDEYHFTVGELKQLEKALYESSEYMMNRAKNEDAIIFVGAARSGKSTLINYLIGNELVAEKPYKGAPSIIKKAAPLSEGPEIGAGSTSKTTIPSRWTSRKLPNLAIWDTPGFDDNRGPVQDITNAFYLYQLLQNVKTLRIIVAIDIIDVLGDNVKPFVSVLRSVEDLLGYRNQTHSSILTIIFTKVPDTLNDEPVNMELVSDILSEKILRSGMKLSDTTKDIVEFLINNHNHMAFFKRAKIGKITDEIDVNIFPAIESSSSLETDTLKDLRPSISDRSKICLFRSRGTLLPKKDFRDLEMVVSSAIENKLQDLEESFDTEVAEDKLGTQITQLNRIERQLFKALAHESDFNTKLEIIQTIDADVRRTIEENNLREKIRLMVFVDKILGLEESNQLALNLQAVLLSSESKVRESITSAQLRQGEITRQKYNDLMEKDRKRHSEELDSLHKKMDKVEGRNKSGTDFLENLIKIVTKVIGILIPIGIASL